MRSVALALTACALAWVAALLVAPLAASRGAVSPLVFFAYEAGGLVCHQIPERSFHLAGVALPVCARCFGLYAAGAAGALLAWTRGIPVSPLTARGSRAALALAAAPTAFTVAVEWLGLMRPSSGIRAIAALPLGVVAGWVIVTMLRQEAADVESPAPRGMTA